MSPVADATEVATSFRMLSVDVIVPSPLNPRKHFDQVKLEELAATMGNGVGVIEPLVVRRCSHEVHHHNGYELVAGERRWRAAQIAGLDEVPCVVKELTDAQVLEIMVIENDQREGINPLEEGDGFKRLMTFGFDIEKLAARIGRSRKYIYDRVKLLDLISPAQQLLLDGRMTAGHAILIARLTPGQQEEAIDPVDGLGPLFVSEESLLTNEEEDAEYEASGDDPYVGLKTKSVRELEAWIASHCRFDASAPVNVELFPDTAAAIEVAEKVISITHSHHVHADAKDADGKRTYGPTSWKRADGRHRSKECDQSVTGVIVVGPGRGEAFRVCINKECNTHWREERLARERQQKAAAGTPAKKNPPAGPSAAAMRLTIDLSPMEIDGLSRVALTLGVPATALAREAVLAFVGLFPESPGVPFVRRLSPPRQRLRPTASTARQMLAPAIAAAAAAPVTVRRDAGLSHRLAEIRAWGPPAPLHQEAR